MCACMCVQLEKVSLPFYCVDSGDGPWVVRFVSKGLRHEALYLLSSLAAHLFCAESENVVNFTKETREELGSRAISAHSATV